MNKEINQHTFEGFLPYLILDESADVEWFVGMMQEEGIETTLKWRYYYGYNDAIRIIDFVETEGIYDAWAVLMPKNCQAKVDKLVQQYPAILSYFEPAEERFFRGLEPLHLEKALASQQMRGQSLDLALKILKEQNILYSKEEVQVLKDDLVHRNALKSAKTARTKVLIWTLIIIIIFAYLWLVGMFEEGSITQ